MKYSWVCNVDSAFMSALHDDLTHDWTNHRDMIIFKTVFRKFYLGAPPLPAKLISYLKTVCVTWHYAYSQSCGIVRYLYYIRLMGSQMQPKRPATWVKYSKKSGCAPVIAYLPVEFNMNHFSTLIWTLFCTGMYYFYFYFQFKFTSARKNNSAKYSRLG